MSRIRILTTTKIHFKFGHGLGTDEKDHQNFTTMGGGNIEEAPSWIQKDPYFDMCIKAKELILMDKNDKPAAEPKLPPDPPTAYPIKPKSNRRR